MAKIDNNVVLLVNAISIKLCMANVVILQRTNTVRTRTEEQLTEHNEYPIN